MALICLLKKKRKEKIENVSACVIPKKNKWELYLYIVWLNWEKWHVKVFVKSSYNWVENLRTKDVLFNKYNSVCKKNVAYCNESLPALNHLGYWVWQAENTTSGQGS